MNAKWIYITVATVGCLLMISGWASAGFSVENLFSDKSVYTQIDKTETIGANDTIEIKTDVERIKIGPSGDDRAHVSYFDREKKKHLYSYDGSVLSLSIDNANRKWYDYISFNFSLSDKVIELRLPQNFKGKLYVREATGRVEVENLAGLEIIDLSLTTGDLSVSGCEASKARLVTTTGRLGVSGLKASELYAESTTGGISLGDIAGQSLTSRFGTGSLAVSNAAFDRIDAQGTTGSIKLDGIVADDIALRSTTGGISGSINGRAEDFTVKSSSVTGNNNLKNTNGKGPRALDAQCTTGDINITFVE